MEITLLMELVADQHEMLGTVEDALDAVISETLAQTEPLADDELEDVQAAVALPFMNQKNLKGEE